MCMRRYGLTWEGSKDKSALGDYYLALGDQLSATCPSCILLIEGTGQSKFLGVDWCARACPAAACFHALPCECAPTLDMLPQGHRLCDGPQRD